jgi:hypothetical protein
LKAYLFTNHYQGDTIEGGVSKAREMRNACKILEWKSEAKGPMAQNRVRWWDNVNMALNRRVPTEAYNFFTS